MINKLLIHHHTKKEQQHFIEALIELMSSGYFFGATQNIEIWQTTEGPSSRMIFNKHFF